MSSVLQAPGCYGKRRRQQKVEALRHAVLDEQMELWGFNNQPTL